jgi:aspartyl-tRNA(Asn)/glutamyl-tRNA(Gln) amidotransferase subunit A
MTPRSLTLTSALKLLQTKKITLSEIYTDIWHSIDTQRDLNAFVTLSEATRREIPEAKGALMSLPIAVKDNFSTLGLRTTASSTVLDTFTPQFESTVTAKLKAAGGEIIGKTNLDAWAHGSSTETSQYGRTLNPRNTAHLPGGSSGGSAAAVAADMCLAAIGSETAGSIRQPAAWCGAVGLKPTYGRASRFGAVAMASSTDSPGPVAKTVEDAALLLQHIAGHDDRDATSSSQAVPDFVSSAKPTTLKGMKIGLMYLDIPGLEDIKTHYETAAKELERLGAIVEPVTALDPHYAISVYTVVQRGEVSSNLARYDGVRYGNDRSFFGAEAKRRIMLGTYTLSKGYAEAYYQLAQKVRTLFIEDYARLFAKYDVLISPTSPGFAKKIGATEGESMFGELEDMLLEPSSITGLPGISVPCYRDPATNLFLGLNIMAKQWAEEQVIKVAAAYEDATEWNTWKGAHE